MSDLYIAPQALERQLATPAAPIVIDVRGDEQYAAGHIPGSLHIPGDDLPYNLDEIPRDRTVVAY